MKDFVRHLLVVCALIALFNLSVSAQSAPTSGQVTPGNVGSISKSSGVTTQATGVSKEKLAAALSPDTRQTLKEAMDSFDPSAPATTASVKAPTSKAPQKSASPTPASTSK